MTDLQSPTTVAELVAAARRHGLSAVADSSELDRSGLDFVVAHVRDEEGVPWIVRAPRRAEVVEAARREARVLCLVRPALHPVAVPDWRVHADDVIAYPRIDGAPAVRLEGGTPRWTIDPTAVPEVFLDTFARTLAALQSVRPDGAVPTEGVSESRAALARAMDETRSALAPSEATWARWQRWLEDDASWPRHLSLVHGDLHPGHMLLDDEGRLIGILDWTEAKVTDPSIDLAMFFGCFGRSALEALVQRFERAGGTTWPRLVHHAAERWAAFPALAAGWALRTNDDAVMEHARSHLAATEAEAAAR